MRQAMQDYHVPVLPDEVIGALQPRDGGFYVDATLGGGGHTELVLEKSSPTGKVLAIDRDMDAIEYATQRLAGYGPRLTAMHGNFGDIGKILSEYGETACDGILFDFGVSSHQLREGRGFSFQTDETLDMRMDRKTQVRTAADVVNTTAQEELANIIYEFGEERLSRRIAAAIVEARQRESIQTTGQLVKIIEKSVGRQYGRQMIHPATRTFQAIRIAVNDELVSVERGLTDACRMLKTGGRVVAISFHSLEDRIVKNTFRKLSGRCTCNKYEMHCKCGACELMKIVTRKAVTATDSEVDNNPRSRSAKLRCAERI